MDEQGGLSVSEVVARSTGERPLPNGERRRADPGWVTPQQARPATQQAPIPADRPPRPRRATAASPLPEAPPRRPAVTNPSPPQSSASQPPRRPRRPVPPATSGETPKPPVPPVPPNLPANGRRPARRAAHAATPGTDMPKFQLDPKLMTEELEAIDEATLVRRKIDHTLARFSAAHDELEAEEAKRRERRERFSPTSLLETTRTALQRVVAPTPAEAPEEKPAQTRLQEKKQRHVDRAAKIGRIVAAVIAALVFLGIGGAWGAQTIFDAKFVQVSALDENSADIQDAEAQKNDENFLMVGSDSRDGASQEEGVGDANGIPGARSDTVMVAHIPADRSRVVVTSFPRDLEIDRPACQAWDPTSQKTTDEVVPEMKNQKLNTAFAVGGPQCTTKVIQQLTGLRINHFVGIDFNGFKEMVDAVHGVTVHNETPIDDSVLGKVLLQTGDVTISGDQALNFVRARHVKGDPTSDYGRIKRQQAFIGALLKKVMSSDVVLNPAKLSDFITAFAKATFGDNLGVKQMMSLAQSMKGLDPAKVQFLTAPTTGMANSRGNEVLVESRNKALFEAIRNNTPLPDPNAPLQPGDAQPPTTGTSKSGTGSSKSTSRTSANTTSKKTSSTG
jgi:LCP family protein required for cell wall assembly